MFRFIHCLFRSLSCCSTFSRGDPFLFFKLKKKKEQSVKQETSQLNKARKKKKSSGESTMASAKLNILSDMLYYI